MSDVLFNNRKACQIENDQVRVTVLAEGGHIAELLNKATGVNPLWIPPWPSIEPSTWDAAKYPEYGNDGESKLLSGIGGQNLCLDIFGGPSPEEALAGVPVHGEGSVVPYSLTAEGDRITQQATFPLAQIEFQRLLELNGASVRVTETVKSLAAFDRPIGWTQHVTLGPPFLERGLTRFQLNATKSKVIESDFTAGKGYQKTGAEFKWPFVPHKNGGTVDLRVYPDYKMSGGYTAHLMNPEDTVSYFEGWNPTSKTWLRYEWNRADFPWCGIWEENCARTHAPWNGKTITRGMEFGVSPMPESRKQMIERGSLFGVPGYRWLGARETLRASYLITTGTRKEFPL
jgi:hypothetical protein